MLYLWQKLPTAKAAAQAHENQAWVVHPHQARQEGFKGFKEVTCQIEIVRSRLKRTIFFVRFANFRVRFGNFCVRFDLALAKSTLHIFHAQCNFMRFYVLFFLFPWVY